MITLDFNLLFNIINIIILCLLLKKFLIKPIRNLMEKREEIINGGLENARVKQEEAESLIKQYNEKLDYAHEEAKTIVANSKDAAEKQYQATIEKANLEAKQIVDNATANAKFEQEKAVSEAKSQIVSLAIDMAEKLAIQNSDEASNKAAYDKFIQEAGDNHDNK